MLDRVGFKPKVQAISTDFSALACERVLREIVTRSLLKRVCRSDGTHLKTIKDAISASQVCMFLANSLAHSSIQSS